MWLQWCGKIDWDGMGTFQQRLTVLGWKCMEYEMEGVRLRGRLGRGLEWGYRQRLYRAGSVDCSEWRKSNKHTHTNVQWSFVRDYQGEPVPEETFTYSHPSWLSNVLYQLPPSTVIHSILFVQFTCLTVLFHKLSPGPVRSTFWSGTLYFILHTFLHPIIIFLQQYMPDIV